MSLLSIGGRVIAGGYRMAVFRSQPFRVYPKNTRDRQLNLIDTLER
jgi:hypothetical protein